MRQASWMLPWLRAMRSYRSRFSELANTSSWDWLKEARTLLPTAATLGAGDWAVWGASRRR